MILVPRLVSNA